MEKEPLQKKIWKILLSRFKRNKNEQWVKERREVCKNCPYNSKNSKKHNILLEKLSHLLDYITLSEKEDLGFCECGCDIAKKTLIEEEQCYSKLIGEEDKWQSIYIPNKAQEKKWKN